MKMKTLALLTVLTGSYAAGVSAKGSIIEGAIAGFECGDNCYLTVTVANGQERTGLCTAPLCQKWNENTSMPAKFKGKKARITVNKGKQYDDAGNVAGEMDAFSQIEIR
ncbi:hypothetical protein [uncultured Thiodictyon sp.]|uniref:hypothetical protein n=1 Tax=uncultured Thiodictyon sp. TaxID=1846217 RepID=UPI0025E7942C|nr:hypothetical protein [uncultured Thiodictyon sp.]